MVALEGQVRITESYLDRVHLLGYPLTPTDASIKISELRSSDSGVYRCEVQHGIEDSHDIVHVQVQGKCKWAVKEVLHNVEKKLFVEPQVHTSVQVILLNVQPFIQDVLRIVHPLQKFYFCGIDHLKEIQSIHSRSGVPLPSHHGPLHFDFWKGKSGVPTEQCRHGFTWTASSCLRWWIPPVWRWLAFWPNCQVGLSHDATTTLYYHSVSHTGESTWHKHIWGCNLNLKHENACAMWSEK